MTTAIGKKTPVEARWQASKLQEEAARVVANHFLAAFNVLSKYGPQAQQEYDKMLLQRRCQYYKNIGVKTPLDLVKAIAEFESNVFGSKIEIWGDESKAVMTYEACGMWNAIQKAEKMTPEMEDKVGAHFENCIREIAREFGLKGEVKFEEPCATVTFTK